jgi:hypothetical protein
VPENNDGKNKNLIALVVFLVVCGYSIFNNQDKVDLSFSIKTDQMHLNLDWGYQKSNPELLALTIQRCIVKELMARISSIPKNFLSKDKILNKISWQKKYPMMWVKKFERIYEDVLQFLWWCFWNEDKRRLEFVQGFGVGIV